MKTDEQDLVVMEDEAIRQGRVVKSIPEPGTVMIEPSPDFEAGWLAARANPPRVEGDDQGFRNPDGSVAFSGIAFSVERSNPMEWAIASARAGYQYALSTPQPAPEERKGVSLSEQVKKLEQENQKLSSSLGQINATLMVNFGPDGREKQILDGNEDEHEAMFKVLRSYARTQAPTEPTREQVAKLVKAAQGAVEYIRGSQPCAKYCEEIHAPECSLASILEKALAPFAEKGGG